jgi:hypothetical protein
VPSALARRASLTHPIEQKTGPAVLPDPGEGQPCEHHEQRVGLPAPCLRSPQQQAKTVGRPAEMEQSGAEDEVDDEIGLGAAPRPALPRPAGELY